MQSADIVYALRETNRLLAEQTKLLTAILEELKMTNKPELWGTISLPELTVTDYLLEELITEKEEDSSESV